MIPHRYITKRKERFKIRFPACAREVSLAENILIMGVLNTSPDSFYISFPNEKDALKQVEKMIAEGADIIDVGGQSTRPGADEIHHEEEKKRVKIIGEIRKKFPDVIISVDTYKSKVAEYAIDIGADMVNDISGFSFDRNMFDLCVRKKVPVVIMHTTGKPKIMQRKTMKDEKLIEKITSFLKNNAERAEKNGLKVIIDPGIGFGKKPYQNLVIINRIDKIAKIGFPILIGTSRKSFLGLCVSLSDPPPPSERLSGTIASCVIAMLKGARIFRVHDIKEIKQALEVSISIINEKFIYR